MAARTRDIAGYRNAELIGQGGFSAVYQASDPDHGRDVAIKVLEGALGDAERRRFDRERQTMGRLGSHPNIIAVYESGYTESGEGYIVMQLATGGSLGARLRAGGPVPWPEACRIMAEIADATQVAHDSGVLHRDIKPDNILIDQYGHPKLSDFGIAAVANNATATMSTTATLAHAAPELLQGQPVSTGVDIYALGSTLCALVTGYPPFVRPGDESVTPMITRALTEPPPDLRLSGIPDAVARIVEQALAKDPAGRQPSAAQMAAQLRAAATDGGSPGGATTGAAEPTTALGGPYAPPPGTYQPTGGGFTGGGFTGGGPPGYGPTGAPPQASGPYTPTPPGYGGPGGYATGQPAPQGFAATTPQPAPGYGYTAGGPTPGGPGAAVGGPAPFHPSNQTGRGGSARVVWLIAAGLAAVVLIGSIGLVLANSGNGSGGRGTATTAASSSTTVAGQNGSGSTQTPPAGTATVSITCPAEIKLGTRIYCDIVSAGATSGQWTLPGFVEGTQAIETVPGTYQIFIAPDNPSVVGTAFTITATVTDAAGQATVATHTFTVVGSLSVTIECPATIPLNLSTTCQIVTEGATAGEWSIPGFGNDMLHVVPGSDPITITPSVESAVGQTYTITATATDASGASQTATHDFTVTAN